MEQEYAQRHQPLSKDEMDLLICGSDSDDIDNLKRLIESLQATCQDLKYCIWAATDGNHAQITRYILEQKYDSVDDYMVQRALKASAIQVLDALKEFGWSNVNMTMAQIGPGSSQEALTALFYATHDPVVVRYLLDQGANPNLGTATGGSIGEASAFILVTDSGAILQSAAMYGNIQSFDLLLTHGAVLSNAATMHAAAEGENIEIIAHLLKLGVDLDQRDTYRTMGFPCYDSPLLRAMVLEKPRAVRFLLDHGASTLRKLPDLEGAGMTAMDSTERGRIEDEIRGMVKEVGER